MATKSIFKRWSGSAWVEYYFKTSADLIDETTTYKVMTATERSAISTYLSTFNTANKLLQLDGSGLVPSAQIPTNLTAYLKTANPAFTGTMTGSGAGNIDIRGVLRALSSDGGATYQYTMGDSQEGFTLTSIGGAILKMDQGVEFNKSVIVGTPTVDTHATTKKYVDDLVATGLKYAAGGPAKVATTANITLSGLQTIDGYTTVASDRVLVKNQTTASENGIYTASATAWTKVTADSVQGTLVFVENGTTQNDWTFQATTLTAWTATTKVDSYLAGAGLTKTGTTFSISSGAITNAMLAGSIAWSKLATQNVSGSYAWTAMPWDPTDGGTLLNFTDSITSAIKLLRGTTTYKDNNTETIAGAYDLAEVKNRTYRGTTSEPTGLTLVTGDLYFYELA